MTLHDALSQLDARFLHHQKLHISLDCADVPFEPAWLTEREPAIKAALTAMEELEGGAIANPDEQRQVGHYWLRDPSSAPDVKTADAITQAAEAAHRFAQQVLSGEVAPPEGGRFTRAISIGIGGSALGPQLVSRALAAPQPPLELHFVDNTDPDGIDRLLASLPDGALAQTLVLVTSKSGGTKETRNGMLEVRRAIEAQGLSFAPRAVAITGTGSALEEQAKSEGWRARFPMWDWVGGRSSVTSVVGLLPAALQNLDCAAFLEGARTMDAWTRGTSFHQNPALALALTWLWLGEGRGDRAMVVLPYKDRLDLFARYLQQLVMESLGKAEDRSGKAVAQGLTVYGNKGSTDQHAFVQQLRDGRDDFFACFLEVLEDRQGPALEVEDDITSGDYLAGFLFGTRTALGDAGRPSITITIPRVDERQIGALIALFERAVGLYAELIDLNAYHQPGVEAGKKAAAQVLDLQGRILGALRAKAGAYLELPEIAEAAGTTDVAEVMRLCRRLAANRADLVRSGADPLRARYAWRG